MTYNVFSGTLNPTHFTSLLGATAHEGNSPVFSYMYEIGFFQREIMSFHTCNQV